MMLSGIFQKRKKIQELRAPSLQDIKKFRDVYTRHAEKRQVEAPSCFEKSIYKAISCQKELHSVDFRQEDVTDPQIIALAEALLEMPIISSLDLRDNRITNDGAKALLEVLRVQVIAAKTPSKPDPKFKTTMSPVPPPDYTRYITNVALRGNEISPALLEEMTQYTEILKREDKRLEVRAALNQIDRMDSDGVDEYDFKAVVKLLTGSEPSKKDLKQLIGQVTIGSDTAQNEMTLENVLLAKCANSPTKKGPSPPWETLVQVRHYNFTSYPSTSMSSSLQSQQLEKVSQLLDDGTKTPTRDTVTIQPSEISNSGIQRLQITSNSSIAIASSQSQTTLTPMPQPRSITISSSPAQSPVPAPTSQPRPYTVTSNIAQTPVSSPAIRPTTVASSPIPSQPPAPTSVHRPISIGPMSPIVASSPTGSPQKVDNRPPASTPPSYLLSTQLSSNSLTPGSPKSPINYVEEAINGACATPFNNDVQSITAKAPAVSPERATITRLNISSPEKDIVSTGMSRTTEGLDSQRKQVLIPSSVARQAKVPDDLEIDLPTLNVEGDAEFTDDEDNGSHGSGVQDELNFVADDEDSKRSVRSMSLSSPRYVATNIPILRSHGNDSNESSKGDITDMSEAELSVKGVKSSPQRQNGCTIDFPTLVYDECDESNWLESSGSPSPQTPRHQETHAKAKNFTEEVEESIAEECVVLDLMRETKSRNVAKLSHPGFKTALSLPNFPGDVPYRNLISLVLSNTGLRNLTLFGEMRFPSLLVLDLSHNRIEKLGDNDFTNFPKLQVLNLEHNQIRTINGLSKLTDVKALNLSHNLIKVVVNLENLLRLQILKLTHNMIGVVTSLRLLSLNKMLQNLDLDENPLVDTEDRQRRKVTVHILNIIPTLRSMGSVPLIGHNSKEKKKCIATEACPTSGKSLLDFEELPDLKCTWIGLACDILQLYQDPEIDVNIAQEEDLYGDLNGSMSFSPTKRDAKRISRGDQRKKDELRSKFVGYRSRGKAPPSPPRVKTSPYMFGPPTSPPVKSPRKGVVNPALAQKQLRRASELSAPKHPPVDQTLMKQEFRRKSRPTFELNMSVAERVLLAQEKASRRPTLTLTPPVHRPSGTGIYPPKHELAPISPTQSEHGTIRHGSPSHGQSSPHKSHGVVEFRIEPLIDNANSPTSSLQQGSSPLERKQIVKDSIFLQSLAVSDFLNHVEEEFSTALTALTVLLSMSEKESNDPNKLKEYRNSLVTLDILNESESRALFEKARAHEDPAKVKECITAFDRIGIVKKCIKSLLDILNTHAPGSAATRSFCHSLRTNELQGIVQANIADDESTSMEPRIPSLSTSNTSKPANSETQPNVMMQSMSTTSTTLNSRLFQTNRSEDLQPIESEVDEFDFLSDDQQLFEDEESNEAAKVSNQLQDVVDEKPSGSFLLGETVVKDDLMTFQGMEKKNDEPIPSIVTSSESAACTKDAEDYQTQNSENEEADSEAWALAERSKSKPVKDDERLSFTQEHSTPTDDNGIDDSFLDDDGKLDGVFDTDVSQLNVHDFPDEAQSNVEDVQNNEQDEVDDDGDFDDEPPYDGEATIETEHKELDTREESFNEPIADEEEDEDQDDEEAEIFGDWEKGFDPSTNHYFWFNHDTGESQWTPPEGWPYVVDVPFEDEEDVEAEESVTVRTSAQDVDEDMFSDEDLPDFE